MNENNLSSNNNSKEIKSNENKKKLNLLAQKLGSLIAPGLRIPEDYTFTINGDTLIISSDRIFGKNIHKDLGKAYFVLEFNKDIKNIERTGNKIYAELSVPIGEVSKIELELEKYRV